MKKLLLYPTSCHPKNIESMGRMCNSLSIQFETTNDRNRLNQHDYDYIWLPNVFVSPDEIPEHIFILYGPHYFVFPDESWLDGVRNEKWSKRCVFNVLSDWNYIVHNEFIILHFSRVYFGAIRRNFSSKFYSSINIKL